MEKQAMASTSVTQTLIKGFMRSPSICLQFIG